MRLHYFLVWKLNDTLSVVPADGETAELDEFRRRQLMNVFGGRLLVHYGTMLTQRKMHALIGEMVEGFRGLVQTEPNWHGFELAVESRREGRAAGAGRARAVLRRHHPVAAGNVRTPSTPFLGRRGEGTIFGR